MAFAEGWPSRILIGSLFLNPTSPHLPGISSTQPSHLFLHELSALLLVYGDIGTLGSVQL